jgi:hypothetical protein
MAVTPTSITISPYTYTQTVPANFGEAYAKGITSAGQSIAGAISSIGQTYADNQTTNDLLTQFSQMKNPDGTPVLPEEDYHNIMNKGAGARKEMVGEIVGRFHQQYASMLDQQKQIAIAQGTAAAQAPYRLQEIRTTGEQQRLAHPENTLAPKIVDSTQANADAEIQKKIQAQIEENRKNALRAPAYVAPP